MTGAVLLTDTADTYLMQAEGSREIFRIIASDASGVPDARIDAQSAAGLLAPHRYPERESGEAETDQAAGGKAAPVGGAKENKVDTRMMAAQQ